MESLTACVTDLCVGNPPGRFPSQRASIAELWWSLGWRALKTPTSETPDFGGHVTLFTLQYLPWDLTGRAWLQAGAQQVVIVVLPPLNSFRINSRNVISYTPSTT